MTLPAWVHIAPAVAEALATARPVVALETAVLTHGLPSPVNLETVRAMAAAVSAGGAQPAVIGIVDGQVIVGLSDDELASLATRADAVKASRREVPFVAVQGHSAGTTVAATATLAHRAGINVFATGGIGGVHRGADTSFDISADLPVLATTPIVVVCSGAKMVLDLPATMEWLETAGVPVVGFGADHLPGFYVRDTGLPLTAHADRPADIATLARAMRALAMPQAMVVAAPPPAEVALAFVDAERWLGEALRASEAQSVSGGAVTPFLLDALARASQGATLRVNTALLVQNAAIAAEIAQALAAKEASSPGAGR